jgi:hypothetical protein
MMAFPDPHRTDIKGMTVRDYFAAKAMQALINRDEWQSTLGEISRNTAFMAYVMADAMMQERKSDASTEV